MDKMTLCVTIFFQLLLCPCVIAPAPETKDFSDELSFEIEENDLQAASGQCHDSSSLHDSDDIGNSLELSNVGAIDNIEENWEFDQKANTTDRSPINNLSLMRSNARAEESQRMRKLTYPEGSIGPNTELSDDIGVSLLDCSAESDDHWKTMFKNAASNSHNTKNVSSLCDFDDIGYSLLQSFSNSEEHESQMTSDFSSLEKNESSKSHNTKNVSSLCDFDDIGYSLLQSVSNSEENESQMTSAFSNLEIDDLSAIVSDATKSMESLGLNSRSLRGDELAIIKPKPTNRRKKGQSSTTSKLLDKKVKAECSDLRRNCRHGCLQDISSETIKNARYRLYTKTFESRVEWLYDKFFDSTRNKDKATNSGNQGQHFFSVDDGRKVCAPCFLAFYKLDKNFYYKYFLKYKENRLAPGWRLTRGRTEAYDIAVYWLLDYAICYGDRMPDKHDILLPYKTQKVRVFQKYKKEESEKSSPTLQRSGFFEMWKDNYPHLKIKQTNSFSKCEKCTLLERLMEKTREPHSRKRIRERIDIHNSRQMQERRYYHHKRALAKESPRDYLSMIIDGMDQSKTNLPHMTGRKSKTTRNSEVVELAELLFSEMQSLDQTSMLQTHIQGVLNHGLNQFYTYVDLGEYAHDSNLVMNVLLKHLHECSIKMNGELPRTFFLQADNCFRENKNRFMLAFCEMLVQLNIFEEINLSFLFVGHTHEDVDAGFSKIAKTLRKNDAETLPRLLHLLPNPKETHGLFNIKSWLMPYIIKLKHHTKPLHFRFLRTGNGKIVSQYKGLHTRPWINFDVNILKSVPKLLFPEKIMKIDVKNVVRNIEQIRLLLLDEGNSKYNWWMRFLNYLEKVQTRKNQELEYAKQDAIWVLPLLPTQKPRSRSASEENVIPQSLQDQIDEELLDPLVIIVRPAKQSNKKKPDTKKSKKRPEKGQSKGKKDMKNCPPWAW